jgi:two-component system sensor histidine kinase PilS (NtrC family)
MPDLIAAGRRLLPWRQAPKPGAVPPVPTMLRWLYIGRLSIAVGVFIGATLAWWQADLTQLLIATAAAVLALLVTGAAAWHSHFSGEPITQTFLYTQALFDLALVTAVVHIGGPYSVFATLYILVIAFNAVLMPLANGLLIALLAGFLYAGDVTFGHPVEISAPLLMQIAVFWLVAITTGYLSSRVRVAGAQTDTLAAELKRARLEAADILRNIKTGIITVGGDGRLAYANPTAEAILGPGITALVGEPALDRLERLAPVLGEAVRRTAQEGRRVLRHAADVTIEGRTFPLGVSTTAVYAEPGEPPSVTAIFKDISDEKRLEALHLRSQRLEAVAEIAASLAHEIKNPLASIRSAVEQLTRHAARDGDERVLANLVLRESDRLSTLLSEFMDFSLVRVTRSQPLDLVRVAEAGMRLALQHPDCSAATRAFVIAEQRPVSFEGDEDLLRGVVFNLVLNAAQAARRGAEITIEVAAVEPASLPPNVMLDAPRLLRVRDTGPGVSLDILPRLFEPFVTGRPGGTGLGLAIVQRAVLAHKGFIFCDSVPGKGAAFTIYLPARFNAEERL